MINHKRHESFRCDLGRIPWSAAAFRSLVDECDQLVGSEAWPRYEVQSKNVDGLRGGLPEEQARGLMLLTQTLRGQVDQSEASVEVVGEELVWPDSEPHLELHLEHLRATLPALMQGDYRSLEVANDAVFGFAREAARHRCCVLLNFSATEQLVTLGNIGTWIAGTLTVEGDGQAHKGGEIALAPYEGRLYEYRMGGEEWS